MSIPHPPPPPGGSHYGVQTFGGYGTPIRLHGNGALAAGVILFSSLTTLAFVLKAVLSPDGAHTFDLLLNAPELPREAVTGYAVAGWTTSLLLVPTWLFTCLWLGVARGNAGRLAPDLMQRHAAWVWFGWLVPVVFLWFPRQVVDDVLAATERPPEHPRVATASWWATWILFLITTRINAVALLLLPAAPRLLPVFDTLVAVAAATALFFWIRVVRRVTAAQNALVRLGPPGRSVSTGWS